MKSTKYIFLGLLLLSMLASQTYKLANPEEVGMSSKRLKRIKPVMRTYIDEEKLPCLITFVARNGKIVHFETYGMKDIDSQQPITENAIFRIASMTKPITCIAAMILYEEGKFQLYDPVSRYIPEFKDLKVFAGGTAAKPILEDPEREILIIDLIRHTAGFTYGSGQTPVDSLYRQKLFSNPDGNLHEMIVKLSEIPLLFHPGNKLHYSISTTVLGYLIQVVSGMPFDKFLDERIFNPLGMNDTGFYIPKDKINRLTTAYQLDEKGSLTVIDHPDSSQYLKKPLAPSGGGGLVSTIMDYYKFAQMILNKGEFGGNRILGSHTVEYMLQDHLPDGIELNPGSGYGIGFGITIDPVKNQIMCSQGEAAWSGALNTYFWIDPKDNLIYMVWTQIVPWGIYDFGNQFRVLVHSSIIN